MMCSAVSMLYSSREVFVFEELGVAGAGMLGVIDVYLVAATMVPCISNVETTGCVRCPCLTDRWDKMSLDLAPKWRKQVCVVVVLLPQVGV